MSYRVVRQQARTQLATIRDVAEKINVYLDERGACIERDHGYLDTAFTDLDNAMKRLKVAVGAVSRKNPELLEDLAITRRRS